ncbi:MAG TPA: hypothetical protein VHW74_13965 [Mycobacteriales bacterium]|jgi:hypothetical protein|nr:hypothetical protein [Mycobacteriales bacterium]
MTATTLTAVQAKELCLKLLQADTATEVTTILQGCGLWDDLSAWRLFSDTEMNYSSIGNQQADAVAALIEKLINAVDARLTNACRIAGVDPEGVDAPQSMRSAVARFFEGKQHPKDGDGRIADWPDSKSTEEGRRLTIAATGNMPNAGQPSLTVADQGEGQTPDDFPATFMSLKSNNKLRIPFVQGKFNMGGTGALRFCELQLVVSRRNPALIGAGHSARDEQWGFTVVRRMAPTAGAKSSVYAYLAPVVLPGEQQQGVLSFAADELPLFPEVGKGLRSAYHRTAPYGSLIKLYEYTWQGTKSNIVFSDDGLLRRIDVGLPELALPIRVYECRPGYKGHTGSFETNALGLVARLDRDKADKLETEEPIGGVIALDDSTQIKLRVYVFRDKKIARQYRSRSSGVVFGINGQMHGSFSTDFFTRNKVNLSYLADSVLVYADCSQIDGQTREDLFMNSRDRLSVNALSRQLEAKLESFLHDNATLRTLQMQRRQKAIQEKLADDKPLNDVLQDLMKSNPTLSKLFLLGQSLPSPFPPNGEGHGGGGAGSSGRFVGKRYPDFFRFKDRKDGEELRRTAQLGPRTRVTLETDAEDAYFIRDHEPGAWNVRRKVDSKWEDAGGWTTTGPKAGIAHLAFDALPEGTAVGDTLEYLIEVTDPARFDAFAMPLTLDVVAASSGGGGGGKSKNHNTGKGTSGGGGSTLTLPNITTVPQADWGLHDFDECSVLKVVHVGTESDELAPVYDFFINTDNKYLLSCQKERPDNAELIHKQFIYGFVLVGLSLIQDHDKQPSPDDGPPIDQQVLHTSRALGGVLIPMLQAVGGLEDE